MEKNWEQNTPISKDSLDGNPSIIRIIRGIFIKVKRKMMQANELNNYSMWTQDEQDDGW